MNWKDMQVHQRIVIDPKTDEPVLALKIILVDEDGNRESLGKIFTQANYAATFSSELSTEDTEEFLRVVAVAAGFLNSMTLTRLRASLEVQQPGLTKEGGL